MGIQFHVITPLARYENVPALKAMLENQGVIWHVITDDDAKQTIEFTEPWIKQYVCPNKEFKFWERCNNSINWFIETQEIDPNGVYCFMNDDDGYELDFFSRLEKRASDVLKIDSKYKVFITSMERGHRIPKDAVPPRRHPTSKLFAHPSYMNVGSVGVEQIFMRGEVLKKSRLPLEVAGDGMMIVKTVLKYPTAYLPDIHVLFNYLEPGRWNK